MNSAQRNTLTAVALLATFLAASPVIAEEDETPAAPSADKPVAGPSNPSLPAVVQARRNPFGSKPVPGQSLASKRGGDRVVNDNQLKGVVADNKASNLTTGMNVISEGAFAGASGLSTVIQNSGNNVLIQNSTIVNVQVK